MSKFFKYLRYVIKHKLFVFEACIEEGLFLQGITHDLSKFLPDEFIPYMNHFYGKEKSDKIKEAFNIAWLKHQRRNKHHWQWWILVQDEEKTKKIEMKHKYCIEMICDWKGAGKAITGKDDIIPWYNRNKDKIIIHEKTRTCVECKIFNYSAQDCPFLIEAYSEKDTMKPAR